MDKPSGWWTTHPTLLMLDALRTRDSKGDGFGEKETLIQYHKWYETVLLLARSKKNSSSTQADSS